MNEVLIYTGEFHSSQKIPFASGGIKAGFPSPAQDYTGEAIDFNKDIIQHPAATFYAKVVGDSMVDAGIDEGDIIVVDRSVDPEDGDIVIAFIDGEFTMKYLDLQHKAEGYIQLRPANKRYKPIRIDDTDNFTVWGVVIWTFKRRTKSLE